MNFRNISAWCIRNPVPPIVLFIMLLLAGLVAFSGMSVNNNPDIDFPMADVTHFPAGRGPVGDGNPDHAEGRGRGPRRHRRRRDQQLRSAKGSATPTSSSRSARRPIARSTTFATPSPRSAATCRTASSSRRSTASTSPATRSCFVAAETTDMSLEELSWYVDNTVSKRLLGGRGHCRRRPAKAASTARSASSSTRPRCRRRGSPPRRSTPSSPDQPQRRRRPRRDRRLRTVGARARQCPRRL